MMKTKKQELQKPTGEGLGEGSVWGEVLVPCLEARLTVLRGAVGRGGPALCLPSRVRHQPGWCRAQHTHTELFPYHLSPERKQRLGGHRFCAEAAYRFQSYKWCAVEFLVWRFTGIFLGTSGFKAYKWLWEVTSEMTFHFTVVFFRMNEYLEEIILRKGQYFSW